jgi:hypothetical protein
MARLSASSGTSCAASPVTVTGEVAVALGDRHLVVQRHGLVDRRDVVVAVGPRTTDGEHEVDLPRSAGGDGRHGALARVAVLPLPGTGAAVWRPATRDPGQSSSLRTRSRRGRHVRCSATRANSTTESDSPRATGRPCRAQRLLGRGGRARPSRPERPAGSCGAARTRRRRRRRPRGATPTSWAAPAGPGRPDRSRRWEPARRPTCRRRRRATPRRTSGLDGRHAVRARTRRARQPVRDLGLHHDQAPPQRREALQHAQQHGHGDVVRQIGDQRCRRRSGQVSEDECVGRDHLERRRPVRRVAAHGLRQRRGEDRVDLDRHHALATSSRPSVSDPAPDLPRAPRRTP